MRRRGSRLAGGWCGDGLGPHAPGARECSPVLRAPPCRRARPRGTPRTPAWACRRRARGRAASADRPDARPRRAARRAAPRARSASGARPRTPPGRSAPASPRRRRCATARPCRRGPPRWSTRTRSARSAGRLRVRAWPGGWPGRPSRSSPADRPRCRWAPVIGVGWVEKASKRPAMPWRYRARVKPMSARLSEPATTTARGSAALTREYAAQRRAYAAGRSDDGRTPPGWARSRSPTRRPVRRSAGRDRASARP